MSLNTDSARRTSAALEAHYQFSAFAAWQRMTRLALSGGFPMSAFLPLLGAKQTWRIYEYTA
jgi:hypothetical protein